MPLFLFSRLGAHETFWHLLWDGVDAIREVPASRWDGPGLYDPDPDVPGRMTTRWGGFLEVSTVFVVLGLLVLTFGWVEDFAARRRPALVPVPVERPVVVERVPEPEPQPAVA